MNDNFAYHSLKLDPSVVTGLMENPTSVPEHNAAAATAHVENAIHPSAIPATTHSPPELGIKFQPQNKTSYIDIRVKGRFFSYKKKLIFNFTMNF